MAREIVVAPGFMDGWQFRLEGRSRLVLSVHGPDAARVLVLAKLGRAPNTDSFDFQIDGRRASELHIPNALAGNWHVYVVHGNQSEVAHAWAQGLPEDFRGSAYRQRPFPDNADQKVTLVVSAQPLREFPRNRSLQVTRGGRSSRAVFRSRANLKVIPGGK